MSALRKLESAPAPLAGPTFAEGVLCDVEQMAAYLGISRDEIYHAIDRGYVPAECYARPFGLRIYLFRDLFLCHVYASRGRRE